MFVAATTTDAVTTAGETIEEGITWLNEITPQLISFAWAFVELLILFAIGNRVIAFLLKWLKKILAKNNKLDLAVQMMLVQVAKVALYLVLISMMLGIFGVETTSLVALFTSAGLSIGLGFQGSLSNMAGGLVLMITKPFQIGDYIKEDTSNNEGVVTKLTLNYTILRTLDEKTVVIPNGNLANSSMTNFSAEGKRRLSVSCGISYNDDILKAKRVMKEVLDGLPYLLPDSDVKVFVDELGESSVVIGSWFWVRSSDYWPALWAANEGIKLAFDREGIHIPYPQMDIHVKEKVGIEK